MGFLDKIKAAAAKTGQEFDDGLTDAIGDGDYTQTTDESTVEKPKDDGKDKK